MPPSLPPAALLLFCCYTVSSAIPATAHQAAATGDELAPLGVELLFLVDDSVYASFLERAANDSYSARHAIHRYFAMVAREVDAIYASARFLGRRLRVTVADIFISKTIYGSPWLRLPCGDCAQIKAYKTLNRLKQFLRTYDDVLPKHDHAIAVTKRNLVQAGVVEPHGMAFVRSVCRSAESVSIVEDTGAMGTVYVVAHDLGAAHDGGGKNKKCLRAENYLMAPAASSSRQMAATSTRLSRCSVKQIEAYLLKLGESAACLYDSTSTKSSVLFDYEPGNKSGQLYTANEQCKAAFGAHFRFCERVDYFVKQMCHRLWCRDSRLPRTAKCVTKAYLPALPGTSCGDHKWCEKSVCADDMNAPPVTGCRLGDSDAGFCSKVIFQHADLCHDARFKRMCCRTCRNLVVFDRVYM